MMLKTVKYRKKQKQKFPYNLPLFQQFTDLNFHRPVTILVGENGTGKSTLLEALAYQAQLPTINSESTIDANYADFARCFQLGWSCHTKKGFFLRSDDFLGFIKRLTQMKKDALADLEEIEVNYKGKSQYAKDLASMPAKHTLGDLKNLYQEGLEYRSHGEGYIDFFQSRFKPNGLYLLDEPEVPLSPMKQLTLISMMKQLIRDGAQFIIATHSPILMAFPDAEIISFDTLPPSVQSFDNLEHVQLTKDFLECPERYLKHL